MTKPKSNEEAAHATPSDNMTLEKIMEINPWKGDQPADTHQAILRGLIKIVAELEEAGITSGLLDASKISIRQGSKVTIRDEPKQNDGGQGLIRKQIKIWVSDIFRVPPASHSNIEYRDFREEIDNAADNLEGIHNAADNFKQLERHPFLLSYERKAYFLLENITTLKNEHTDWKWQYKKEGTNPVKIYDIIPNEKGYSDVLRRRKYEENALGALLYSRNVVDHFADHFGQDSIEEVGKRLSEFFPEMMLGFYKFVVKKGIDTRSEPKSVNFGRLNDQLDSSVR